MELLPCPFCGGTSVTVEEGTTYRWAVATCVDCGATASEVHAVPDVVKTQELALAEWNRRASPASAPEGLFVREGAMHESNGRVTYFVHLAKNQDAKPWDCYVVYSGAIQGRAQYEAAQLRHFLGQGPKPDILTFDTDAPTPPVSEDRWLTTMEEK